MKLTHVLLAISVATACNVQNTPTTPPSPTPASTDASTPPAADAGSCAAAVAHLLDMGCPFPEGSAWCVPSASACVAAAATCADSRGCPGASK